MLYVFLALFDTTAVIYASLPVFFCKSDSSPSSRLLPCSSQRVKVGSKPLMTPRPPLLLLHIQSLSLRISGCGSCRVGHLLFMAQKLNQKYCCGSRVCGRWRNGAVCGFTNKSKQTTAKKKAVILSLNGHVRVLSARCTLR